MRRDTENKFIALQGVKNIHGIDITDFSDQIISKGKIQGAYVSCGLHVHFSCDNRDTKTYTRYTYELVELPWKMGDINIDLELYRRTNYEKEEPLEVIANVLTKPVIKYIIEEMDKAFFDRFAPKEGKRTKFRQPGFYELKKYGFEYRSLPINDEVLKYLPEIVDKGFELLKSL